VFRCSPLAAKRGPIGSGRTWGWPYLSLGSRSAAEMGKKADLGMIYSQRTAAGENLVAHTLGSTTHGGG
jgi:hypothetical protein